jgi:hypothetical protein
VKEWLNLKSLKEKLDLISTQKLFQANAIMQETTNEGTLYNKYFESFFFFNLYLFIFLEIRTELKNHLEKFLEEFSVEKLVTDYKDFVAKIGETHLVEGQKFLRSFLETSQPVVFEGAQGALLDTEYQ